MTIGFIRKVICQKQTKILQSDKPKKIVQKETMVYVTWQKLCEKDINQSLTQDSRKNFLPSSICH